MDRGDRSERSQSFGAAAAAYDRFRPEPPPEALEWVLGANRDTAVDIGAGTGALTRQLVRLVRHVVAVEPDPRMSDALRARLPDVTVLSGRAEAIPLPDASVDAVIGSSMWHWVDEERATAEVARVLRPGGVLGLLWNGPDRSHRWLAELLAESRGKPPERTDGGADGGGEDEATRRRHDVHLPDGAPFSSPETRTVHWSVPMSPDQLVGLAGTYSRLLVLPDDERTRLLKRLTTAIGQIPELAGRDEIELPMRCACWRAVRRP